jgi:hypothetical protein
MEAPASRRRAAAAQALLPAANMRADLHNVEGRTGQWPSVVDQKQPMVRVIAAMVACHQQWSYVIRKDQLLEKFDNCQTSHSPYHSPKAGCFLVNSIV